MDPTILDAIKRDIKTDHLPASPAFARTHFGNRPLNRLTTEEIFAAYEKDLLAGDADLAEWVVNHWVFQHGDVYNHFAERLSQISEDYSEIQGLTEEESEKVLEGAISSFGALNVYLFSVLNGVVFPESVFQSLREAALKEEAAQQKEAAAADERQTVEQMKEKFAREIARVQEKCEGKIAGVLKKYATEVEALKKQIRSLQKQIASK